MFPVLDPEAKGDVGCGEQDDPSVQLVPFTVITSLARFATGRAEISVFDI